MAPPTSRHWPRLLHPFFVGMGSTLLMAALFTDYMYSSNSLIQWSNFSTWLILGGLVLALVAAIMLLVDIFLLGAGPISWMDFALLSGATILSIFNELVHTRDAWTSVVPTGITLSVVVTLFLLVVGLRGWTVTGARTAKKGETA